MERQKIMDSQRHDSDVHLEGFTRPKFMDKCRHYLELPDQFLRFMTLREGCWIVTVFLMAVALSLNGFILTCLFMWREPTDQWWHDRFRDDFDFYFQDENVELINRLWPLWVPFAYAIITSKFVYVFTGCLNIYALVKKTVRPAWYIPWMIMTFLFCAIMWLMAFVMIVMALIFVIGYRPLTVTWDVAPIAIVIVYGVAWTYSLFVVIAHYKRRVIVKYWRDRGVIPKPEETSIEEKLGY